MIHESLGDIIFTAIVAVAVTLTTIRVIGGVVRDRHRRKTCDHTPHDD